MLIPIRPLAFAVTLLTVWLVQMIMTVLWLLLRAYGQEQGARLIEIATMLNLLVGALLVVLLLRAWRWRSKQLERTSKAVRKERQRIARDLHDHVGSQIVNAMMMLDPQAAVQQPNGKPVIQALEQCMLDLRLLVEMMSENNDSLVDYLANLRHRLQPVLDSRGITLGWEVSVTSEDDVPKGARAREVGRLVQEAVSNVLQHSRATHMEIALRPVIENGALLWLLSVSDDGIGMPKQLYKGPGGRGLLHMQKRALRAGATLQIDSPPDGGTQISVIMPGSEVDQLNSDAMPLFKH